MVSGSPDFECTADLVTRYEVLGNNREDKESIHNKGMPTYASAINLWVGMREEGIVNLL